MAPTHEPDAVGAVALVTGANTGIGLSVCRALARQGLRVLLGARNPQRGAAAVELLAAEGLGVELLTIDVIDDDSVTAAAAEIGERFGRLDVLVNNAAVKYEFYPARPSETSLETVRQTYETNVFGTIRVTLAMLPLLQQAETERIVNVTSTLGSLQRTLDPTNPQHPVNVLGYCTSKTALNAVTVHFANELLNTAIKVNAADPGSVASTTTAPFPGEKIIEDIDPAFRHNFQLIEVNGRKTLMLNDRLYRLIPNPTYDPVGSPGAMVEYFRGHNPEGKTLKELCGPLQRFDPAFRFREERLNVLDAQGVDLCWMLPTLALGLEEMLWETPFALAACARAINRWLEEEWTFNIDDRVHTAGVLSFIDPGAAEQELRILLDAGCRLIGVRPAPVRVPGVRRSIADPIYDRVWAMVADAGAVVGFHAADTGTATWSSAGVKAAEWRAGSRRRSARSWGSTTTARCRTRWPRSSATASSIGIPP